MADKLPVKSLAEREKEKTALSGAAAIVEVEVVVLTAPLLLTTKYSKSVEVEFQAMFKVVVATRQPPDDKVCWHWEMEKEEMTGGVVSGTEEDELDDELPTELDDEEEALLELAEEDESAEEAETPVPPPPKPGIIVATNFGWTTSLDDKPAEEAGKPDIELDSDKTPPSRTPLDGG